jgi:deazaflavin-dependent oxidoreductase (nitroreductase family)
VEGPRRDRGRLGLDGLPAHGPDPGRPGHLVGPAPALTARFPPRRAWWRGHLPSRAPPLSYLHDGDDQVLVIATAAGTPRNPAWYHNLLAHPRVTVEIGTDTYEAEAVPLDCTDRDRAFARAMQDDPVWADYEARAGRVAP